MKKFEDSSWENMRQLLDVSLPVRRKKINILWWFALPLFMCATSAAIYFYQTNNTVKEIKTSNSLALTSKISNRLNSFKSEKNADINSSNQIVSNIYQNQKGDEINQATKILIENDLITKQVKRISKSQDLSLNRYSSKLETKISNESQSLNNKVNEKHNMSSSSVNTLAVENFIAIENTSSLMKTSTMNNIDPFVPFSDEINLLQTLNIESIPVEDLSFSRVELTPINSKLKKSKLLNFYLGANAYSSASVKYYGIALRPELRLNLSKKSAIFLGINARVRKTREEAILNEYNYLADSYIELNNLTSASFDQIAINKSNINPYSYDLGLDIGYKYEVIDKLSFGALAFLRSNNIFNMDPIEKSKSGVNTGYLSSAKNRIGSKINNLNKDYSYGAGLDVLYSLGRRSELSAGVISSFNKKKSYEVSLGYGFRIL